MDSITRNFVFQRGRVGDEGTMLFLTYNHKAAMEQVPNGQLFILWDGKNWTFRDVAWSGISLSATVTPKLACYLLGRDGEVLVGTESGFTEERISERGVGPITRGPLQDIKIVGESVFAVGMGRQVYRRAGPDQWVRLETGIDASPPPPTIVGFNAIDGISERNLYAVGWRGEIWHYDGKRWADAASPTNQILHDVLAVSSESVFVCGHNGALVAGSNSKWKLLDYEGPRSNWRTMAWFRDKLYLADGHAIYRLEGILLAPLSLGSFPALSLHATKELLLAVAADAAYTTKDGEHWVQLPR